MVISATLNHHFNHLSSRAEFSGIERSRSYFLRGLSVAETRIKPMLPSPPSVQYPDEDLLQQDRYYRCSLRSSLFYHQCFSDHQVYEKSIQFRLPASDRLS